MNQAIFARLLVQTDVLEDEGTPVYQLIRSRRGSTPHARTKRVQNGQSPHFQGALVPTLVNWCG
jgi:hypothetical protein